MKTLKNSIGIIMIFTALVVTTSCDKNEVAATAIDNQTGVVNNVCTAGGLQNLTANFVQTAPLSQDEIDGLLYLREEEKLAHDVYIYFYNQYNLNVFNNISASEQKHTDAILSLINFYGLTDPALPNAGQYSNPTLQQLYNNLITQGSVSVEDALDVGALIEEVDIIDLQTEISGTTNANLLLVYNNLLKGSSNHLRAFVKNLGTLSVTYTPQLSDQAAYDLIIASSNGNGNGNNSGGVTCTGTGKGNGHNGGNGGKGGKGGNGPGN